MENDDPRAARPCGLPAVLDDMSVNEMERYIAWLTAEIERVRTAISHRGGQMSAAEHLFRSKDS